MVLLDPYLPLPVHCPFLHYTFSLYSRLLLWHSPFLPSHYVGVYDVCCTIPAGNTAFLSNACAAYRPICPDLSSCNNCLIAGRTGEEGGYLLKVTFCGPALKEGSYWTVTVIYIIEIVAFSV